MKQTSPHKFPVPITLEKVMETEIGNVYFYGNIVVVEAHEGVTISYTTGFSILVAGLKKIGAKPWVYIANRVNSYSVNPNDYKYLDNIPTLKGIAIVSRLESARKNAELEKKFSKKSIEIFEDIEEAYIWAEKLLVAT